MTREFSLSELISEMRLLVLEQQDWIDRARSGEIKRTDIDIDRKEHRLSRIKDIGNLLIKLKKEQIEEEKNE